MDPRIVKHPLSVPVPYTKNLGVQLRGAVPSAKMPLDPEPVEFKSISRVH